MCSTSVARATKNNKVCQDAEHRDSVCRDLFREQGLKVSFIICEVVIDWFSSIEKQSIDSW